MRNANLRVSQQRKIGSTFSYNLHYVVILSLSWICRTLVECSFVGQVSPSVGLLEAQASGERKISMTFLSERQCSFKMELEWVRYHHKNVCIVHIVNTLICQSINILWILGLLLWFERNEVGDLCGEVQSQSSPQCLIWDQQHILHELQPQLLCNRLDCDLIAPTFWVRGKRVFKCHTN